eukprot:scaffold3651_cov230-Prasinococcus_capsulatus_cf.AAC.6
MAEGDGYLYIADDSLYTPSLQAIPDAQPTHPLDTHAMAGGRPTAAETQDAESQSEDPDADLVDAVFSALQTAADTFADFARSTYLDGSGGFGAGIRKVPHGVYAVRLCMCVASSPRYYADSCVGGGDIDITNAVKLAVQLAGGMAGIPAVTEFFKGLVGNATTLGAAMSHADGRSLGCGGTPSRGRNPKTIHYYNYGFVVRDRAGGCGGGRNKLLKAARTLCEMAFGVDTEKVEYYTALFRRYQHRMPEQGSWNIPPSST